MRFTLAITLWLWAVTVSGHGGGLDANGCHHNRKTGDYHCHRASHTSPAPPVRPSTPQPPTPVQAAIVSSASPTAIVTASSLLLRSRQSINSPALMRLRQGSSVSVLDARGRWWKVDPDGAGPLPSGYAAARYLASDAEPQVSSKPLSRTDAEIAQEIIAESMARYPGSCGCPYQTDRAGRRCGARSAYVRRGGYSLYCFATDIPESVLRGRR